MSTLILEWEKPLDYRLNVVLSFTVKGTLERPTRLHKQKASVYASNAATLIG
ncbi:hypothetical protein MITS9509_02458 [Synechococcus sp. MIT S9509]|uniref:hypothetical protein n=1 Tax=unclassified Synechococcus TaxID=2626047 RepID=UPI0007BB5969|nr:MULTISPECIES: hypothetical protein [unclassified Synechococcus]KZR85372.1 hypothetical protein MITS9504_02278 [Synechococcus sp. MIT S9504]KZR91522.1 hypothetical protein MITS9509_02458 [Synechococcus sp. MIT S9509]